MPSPAAEIALDKWLDGEQIDFIVDAAGLRDRQSVYNVLKFARSRQDPRAIKRRPVRTQFLPPTERHRCTRLYLAGSTPSQIAEITGKTRGCVGAHLAYARRLGELSKRLLAPCRTWTKEENATLFELLEAGCNIATIAGYLGRQPVKVSAKIYALKRKGAL